MAERIVRGWSVPASFEVPDVDGMLDGYDAELRDDVFMTLGEGEHADGAALAREALDELKRGQWVAGHEYEYTRVTEFILSAVGHAFPEAIEMVTTYYLPNEAFGRWNPVLEKIGCPKLAKVWGENNMSFGWPITDWPVFTRIENAALEAIGAELSGAGEAPDEMLGLDPSSIRVELEQGLATLHRWIAHALEAGQDVVLLMDGDQ